MKKEKSLRNPYHLFNQIESKLFKKYTPTGKTKLEFLKEFAARKTPPKAFTEEFIKFIEGTDYLGGLKLKKEFIKRNEELQKAKGELLNLIEEYSKTNQDDDKQRKTLKRQYEIAREIVPNALAYFTGFIGRTMMRRIMKNPMQGVIQEPPYEFEDLLISSTFSPIDIVYSEEHKIKGYRNLDPQQISLFEECREREGKQIEAWRKERDEDGPEDPDSGNALALDAVDLKEKTITVRINLNRQRKDIESHLEFLLNLLEYEAGLLGYDLGSPRKPQWDVYEKYLQVYDLRKTDPPTNWPEIAKRVFPEEVETRKAPHRKTRKTELPSRTSVKKVKYYYDEAVKMINGGWKYI